MNRADADLNDDLGEIFGSPLRTEPVAPPATYKPLDFSEPCRKCNGSGQFRGYTGRALGPCFACKGAGKNTFKTSPEARAKARTNVVARKARTETENVEAFRAAHPDLAPWVFGNGSFPFAVAMCEAIKKWGSLTDSQLAAVRRCVEGRAKAQAAAVARVENAPTITVAAIEAAFDAARAAGKTHKLHLDLDTFEFKPAKATGKNPGAIYVCEAGEYLGKVVAGKFQATRECGDERAARILAAAADPKAAAIAFGKRTGSCSCCRRLLTDPASIAAGIGPICATKHGW